MTVTRTALQRNAEPIVFSFDTQLEADLARGIRGGNKARLVARCYLAVLRGNNAPYIETAYAEFRDAMVKKTFHALHEQFDHILPAEFRTKQPGTGAGRGRQAKQANGLSPAQQKKFDSFLKAPVRLEKRFLKSAGYFRSCGNTAQLNSSATKREQAAEACRQLIGDTQAMAGLWNLGMRTGGELELQMEKTFKL